MFNQTRGSILIFSVWVLSLLTIFASFVGLRIRQRATVLARIEERNQIRRMGMAGIKKAVSLVRMDFEKNFSQMTAQSKQFLFNNPERFGRFSLGDKGCELINDNPAFGAGQLRYGVSDEESRINLNFADWNVIRNLLVQILDVNEQEITALTDAIVSWREFGATNLEGFYSDSYYQNLPYPYEPKEAEFEHFEELRLVKGIDEMVYQAILPYVTIYGDGQVNVNTASREVLIALGMDVILADKFIQVRMGEDGAEGTTDDFVFSRIFDAATDVSQRVELTTDEARRIDQINAGGMIKTESYFYRLCAVARDQGGEELSQTMAVLSLLENRIVYWREK